MVRGKLQWCMRIACVLVVVGSPRTMAGVEMRGISTVVASCKCELANSHTNATVRVEKTKVQEITAIIGMDCGEGAALISFRRHDE